MQQDPERCLREAATLDLLRPVISEVESALCFDVRFQQFVDK